MFTFVDDMIEVNEQWAYFFQLIHSQTASESQNRKFIDLLFLNSFTYFQDDLTHIKRAID